MRRNDQNIIIFVFHQCCQNRRRSTVRPPRLGGNQRVGVFASRSGFRPNPIGQSVVELTAVERTRGKICLRLRGIDLLDGTPVLDIKPYLPYADCRPEAKAGYASARPKAGMTVRFTDAAAQTCRMLENRPTYPRLERLITDMLALDPRPGYADTHKKKAYGVRLWDLNIRFQVVAEQIR